MLMCIQVMLYVIQKWTMLDMQICIKVNQLHPKLSKRGMVVSRKLRLRNFYVLPENVWACALFESLKQQTTNTVQTNSSSVPFTRWYRLIPAPCNFILIPAWIRIYTNTYSKTLTHNSNECSQHMQLLSSCLLYRFIPAFLTISILFLSVIFVHPISFTLIMLKWLSCVLYADRFYTCLITRI